MWAGGMRGHGVDMDHGGGAHWMEAMEIGHLDEIKE